MQGLGVDMAMKILGKFYWINWSSYSYGLGFPGTGVRISSIFISILSFITCDMPAIELDSHTI